MKKSMKHGFSNPHYLLSFLLFIIFLAPPLLSQEQQYDYFQKWLTEDVLYIITDQERSVFLKLTTTEEKERFIESFWQHRDSESQTSWNEFKEEHYRRIAYSNENFHSGQNGWRTDRGRIYIVFGPPTSIERHPTGVTHLRPLKEGGGITTTYPFEKWYYNHLENIGSGIEVEFVDKTGTGEYRIALRDTEKDALLTTGGGKTLFESMGLESRTGRIRSAALMRPAGLRGDSFGGLGDNPFLRLEKYIQLTRPPQFKFKDLRTLVETNIKYNQLSFEHIYHLFRYTDDLFLAPITIAIENQQLTFKGTPSLERATVNLYGKLQTLTGNVVYEFEEIIQSDRSSNHQKNRSLYQRYLPVKPGRYKLTLIIKDVGSNKLGTSQSLIEVGKPPKNRLYTSSLVLADWIGPHTQTEFIPDPFVTSGRLKVYPNVGTRFRSNNPLGMYMEIYGMKIDQTQQRPHITVTCQITDTLGNLLDQKTLQEKALVFDGSKLIISMLWPENTFLAGKYRLKMNIEDQISQQTISTEASFQVLGSAP